MKKVIAIVSFVMITAGFALTGCEPGQKTTNPNSTSDTATMQNSNNGTVDTTMNTVDTTQAKPGK